jgi:adenylylsulfate kinase
MTADHPHPHLHTMRLTMNTSAFTVWLTGLSGAGKSTIATRLGKVLGDRGVTRVEILDGDEVRRTLSFGAGFSREDRDSHIRRIAYVCQLLARHDVTTIVAAISPYREMRAFARSLIDNFVEVFVDAPLEILEQRDPKGLYKRVKQGQIQQFTGVSDPYEPPEAPEVVCRTDREAVEDSVAKVLVTLEERGYVEIEPDTYSPEEEADIRTRLRSLGYL